MYTLSVAGPSRPSIPNKRVALPQQHGAWVMWGGPLLVGMATAGAWDSAQFWLALTSLGAFLTLHPLTILVKTVAKRRPAEQAAPARIWLAAYGAVTIAGGCGLWLSGAAWVLWLGVLAAPAAVWQLALVARREERRQMGMEVVGAGVLALNALAAHAVAAGGLVLAGLTLWMLCWMQAAGAIVYVFACLEFRRMKAVPEWRERGRISRGALLTNAANFVIVAGLAVMSLAPVWASIPFALMLVEALRGGLWRPPVGARPTAIGARQAVVSTLFYLLLIGAYGLGGS